MDGSAQSLAMLQGMWNEMKALNSRVNARRRPPKRTIPRRARPPWRSETAADSGLHILTRNTCMRNNDSS